MAEESAAEKRIAEFLEGALFQVGLDDRWGQPELVWPHLVIDVMAADKPASPQSYCFRFELTDYPAQAPTASVWDRAAGQQASTEDFPRGGDLISAVFIPGQAYLYLPCDRLANPQGHPEWKSTHPELLWTSAKDLTLYLNEIHRLLNSKDYQGITRPRTPDELSS